MQHPHRSRRVFFFLLVLLLLLLAWFASYQLRIEGYALKAEEAALIPNKQPLFGVGKYRIMQQAGEDRPCGRKAFLLQEGACRPWAECPEGYECKGPTPAKSKDKMTTFCTCQPLQG
ncbi:hypothetical protein HYS50_00100 [Candidatus Woesearchaeota archaeon]|nr:hypothetical protein [Candidatus Woesearchaeota archaeon]